MKKGIDYTGITIVYFCHDGQGNVLMQRRGAACRDEQGRWDIGGGGLDFGDSVEETITKEIKEEYGTEVLTHEFLGYRDVHREQNGVTTHWIALDFKVLVDRTSVTNGEPHKFDAVDWFTLTTLPAPLHSQLPFFFDRYRAALV